MTSMVRSSTAFRRSDFVLEEDGRPQIIRDFSREGELPLTLGLLIDTGSSQRRLAEQERSASGHFIDQALREDKDKAFLIHFDREVELLQDLTPSKQKMTTALDSLQRPQFKQNDDDTSGGSGHPRGGRGSGRGQWEARYLRFDLSGRERTDAETARTQDHRRSFRGIDRGSKVTLGRAIEAAQRANTVVYSVLFGRQARLRPRRRLGTRRRDGRSYGRSDGRSYGRRTPRRGRVSRFNGV